VRVRGGDVEGARRDLAAEGVEARPTASSPVGLHLPAGTDLRASALFKAGRIELQDEGSQLLGLAAALPARGGAVLDACAGAGGKTLQLLETAGRVVALEPDEAKRKELRRRLERAGASAQIEAEELEAHAERTPDRFDVVLIDAPCTGTGTLRRHPEIALRLTPADVEREVARQKRLVAAGLRCLKPGGRLVYATCSVLREENEAIVEYARVEGGGVQPAPVFTGELGERLSRVSALRIGPEPGNGPDGFFVAALTLD
jgi:16S rRNA (cytosine967-C5)-methyltransferase